MFHEFPKALYLNGVHLAVASPVEEEMLRAEGWTDWRADFDHMNPSEPAVDGGADEQQPEAPDVDEKAALLAEAEAAGVKVDARWGIAKLRKALGK